jgi:hypothetical protein
MTTTIDASPQIFRLIGRVFIMWQSAEASSSCEFQVIFDKC